MICSLALVTSRNRTPNIKLNDGSMVHLQQRVVDHQLKLLPQTLRGLPTTSWLENPLYLYMVFLLFLISKCLIIATIGILKLYVETLVTLFKLEISPQALNTAGGTSVYFTTHVNTQMI